MKKSIKLAWIGLAALLAGVTAEAREVIPLNEGWRFFYQAEQSSDNARTVTLPHSWNRSMAVGLNFIETTGCYRNTLNIPIEWASQRIFLKFHGAQTVTDLFVNGKYVGTHRGGATAFAFEITDKVQFDADNEVLVTVSNCINNDILPVATDINRYGGLYRGVDLIITEKTAISPLYLGSEGVLIHPKKVSRERVEGEVEVHLLHKNVLNGYLTLRIVNPRGKVVATQRQKVRLDSPSVSVPFVVEKPDLWNPEQPKLYEVRVAVGPDESREYDQVTVRTGFRKLEVTAEGGLRINDQQIALHGVSLYHDNAWSGGTLTAADMDLDLAMVRDLGANAIRSAVMPHAQYLYNRCDERGFLAWVDLPFQRSFLSDMAYRPTPSFEENGLQQLREIIAQNINHPSVVMWGLFSRLWTRNDNPIGYLKRLHAEAHAIDPSRPTTACSDQDGDINFITDLIVWRQDVGWYRGSTDDVAIWHDLLRERWSHLRSAVSYGGEGAPGHRSSTQSALNDPFCQPEEKQTRFHEEYSRHLQQDSLFWGVWLENLCDYGSNRNPYGINSKGLVSFDRRTKKDSWYLYRALWNSRRPTLHITGRRNTRRNEEQQSFRIYSSSGVPTLLVDADTVAMTEYARCQYQSDTVTLTAGRHQVRAVAGMMRDSITFHIDNRPQPKPQPGLLRIANQ